MATAIVRDDIDDSYGRVGCCSHEIEKCHLRPGDHIYCWCSIWQHHGIYIGEPGREVIHLGAPKTDDKSEVATETGDKSTATICATSLEEFLDGHPLCLVAYDVTRICVFFKLHGSHHRCKSRFLNDVVATAKHYCDNPQEWRKHSLALNNSEDFAFYCKTEKRLTDGQFFKLLSPVRRVNMWLTIK